MLTDAVDAFCQHDEELARDVVERDSDVDRLVLLVARQLERVADHAWKISEATLALDGTVIDAVAEEVKARARDSVSVLEQAMKAFKTGDTNLANVVLGKREQEERLFEITRRMVADKQPEAAPSISLVLYSLLRIREYGFNIAENALDVPASRRSRAVD